MGPFVSFQELNSIITSDYSEYQLYQCLLQPFYSFTVVSPDVNELNVFEQDQLQRILDEFKDVFPIDLPSGLPPKRAVDHKIDLVPGAQPVSIPPYRMSQLEEDELARQLDDYLKQGYIRIANLLGVHPYFFERRKRVLGACVWITRN